MKSIPNMNRDTFWNNVIVELKVELFVYGQFYYMILIVDNSDYGRQNNRYFQDHLEKSLLPLLRKSTDDPYREYKCFFNDNYAIFKIFYYQ